MIESEPIPSAAPSPEPAPAPLPESPVRRFFRDIDSAGNFEDGMEFHAAGIVVSAPSGSEAGTATITVLYLNPFTAKVEKRSRDLSAVILYEFPQDDGVYWRLWDQTHTKLEKLRTEQ